MCNLALDQPELEWLPGAGAAEGMELLFPCGASFYHPGFSKNLMFGSLTLCTDTFCTNCEKVVKNAVE